MRRCPLFGKRNPEPETPTVEEAEEHCALCHGKEGEYGRCAKCRFPIRPVLVPMEVKYKPNSRDVASVKVKMYAAKKGMA